jgi:hypothetical protein
MGQAIPSQHPAVVLRSRFNHVRALLAIATIGLVGLAAAVVILATDDDRDTSAGSAAPLPLPAAARAAAGYDGPIESINYGDSNYVNPSTGYPLATSRPESPGTRSDGGPEEGTADVSQAQPRVTQSQALPGLASQALEATQAPAQATRYDGGPEEGTSGALSSGADSSAVPGIRYDGGPEEGTSGAGH